MPSSNISPIGSTSRKGAKAVSKDYKLYYNRFTTNHNIGGLPPSKILTNDANIKIKEVIRGKGLIIECEAEGEDYCPYCGSFDLRCKDSYTRHIKNISIGLNATILRIKTHKYVCKDCGRYFCSRPRGLLKHQRSMESFKKEVFHKHYEGVFKKDLTEL